MTSKEVINYIEKEGINKLYKRFEKYFAEVDKWSEIFATGDLLDEYQLSHALERLTGIFMKFNIIANAIDAYKTNQELAYCEKAFNEAEKKPIVAQIEKNARASTRELRTYRGDFLNYANSAERGISTCQSRLKRLSVEKGAKGIDFTGEIPMTTRDDTGFNPGQNDEEANGWRENEYLKSTDDGWDE